MSLIKLNNRAVKDVTEFGSISSLGSLTHISTATASASASIEFTSGIDSTYKEYIFYFVNIHPATDNVKFLFQGSTNGGSSYGITITSSAFYSYHGENDVGAGIGYYPSEDLAQSTSFQPLIVYSGNENDECVSGSMQLFNPSSTTFVKHFISRGNAYSGDYSQEVYVGGYFNTTSAINAVQFKMSSGNIDAGEILLFGVN